ncbi:MAG: tRNA glutamyl-Q(34) synthetase GluQRS [Pseudomonadota bacterium]
MITRFAPSPTGPLHLGHAFSAITAHDRARAEGGCFLLRLEDIDQSRARPEWEALIYEDLQWLGLSWETQVLRQSDRLAAYGAALDRLWADGLLFPCSCTRRDIAEALSAPQEGVAPAEGPDGPVYPGTCRPDAPPAGPRPNDAVLRLNMARAARNVAFREETRGSEIEISRSNLIEKVGDIVLARRGMGTSYHLAVTVDDAAQGITHVIRGEDLFEATQIHVLLQRLLGLPTPEYHHHRLIRDAAGKRLAKRDDARALRAYRAAGATPDALRAELSLPPTSSFQKSACR